MKANHHVEGVNYQKSSSLKTHSLLGWTLFLI